MGRRWSKIIIIRIFSVKALFGVVENIMNEPLEHGISWQLFSIVHFKGGFIVVPFRVGENIVYKPFEHGS